MQPLYSNDSKGEKTGTDSEPLPALLPHSVIPVTPNHLLGVLQPVLWNLTLRWRLEHEMWNRSTCERKGPAELGTRRSQMRLRPYRASAHAAGSGTNMAQSGPVWASIPGLPASPDAAAQEGCALGLGALCYWTAVETRWQASVCRTVAWCCWLGLVCTQFAGRAFREHCPGLQGPAHCLAQVNDQYLLNDFTFATSEWKSS